ncbi:MAG: cyclopropane-fatty-acyl-phospholipid synthase family protein [Acidobacteriia bacterium]|nr:cyclopropane-fatty-acyl-phospholipid synthase family protein [Terriglobia bacterium]
MQLLAKSRLREPRSLVCAEFLDVLLKDYPRRDFQVRLSDGATWGAEKQPRFTLVLKHPGALRAMFSSPSELTLGEAYIHDDFDIEGDIEAAFDLADYLLGQERSLWESFDLSERLHRLPKSDRPRASLHPIEIGGRVHTKDRDRKAISYHYDLPAEFYALWLDRHVVYSCAYFAAPDEDLESAQVRKLDYICRKLRLRRGERLLDIGCGWGALIMHAVAQYGVEAVGITLSVPQAEMARERLREAGLNDRCRVEVSDYRDIDHDQQYDKIVSVGMFEHVGEALLPEYFRRAWDLLRPAGVFLNHGIAYSATYHRRGPSFTDLYAFPGGELVPISTSLRAAELTGFEVRDVESLREHYALTLRHWVRRLENCREEARRITSDTTYRIWRVQMAGSAHGFRIGRLNVYQTLLAKPLRGQCGLPLTRDDWYSTQT